MSLRRVVVIGASAGGVEALKDDLSGIPADIGAPIFVVLHIPPFVASSVPQILDRAGPLPAIQAEDGAKIANDVICVAPPDHHLLVEVWPSRKGPRIIGYGLPLMPYSAPQPT